MILGAVTPGVFTGQHRFTDASHSGDRAYQILRIGERRDPARWSCASPPLDAP